MKIKMNKFLMTIAFGAIVFACSKVPVTGRRQLNLLPETQMIGMSTTAYADVLTQTPPLAPSDPRAQRIERIGNKIALQVEEYLKEEKQSKRIKGFEWEFKVVDDPTVNAWCMPGGKVVFYTGILDVCETDEGIAVVMGHEIAHAIARHGNERMSQGLAIQLGGASLSSALGSKPEATQALFAQCFGVGSTLGSLAFSRKHESEADKMGLIFMSMAGYNPAEAVEFWKRMKEASGGAAPPELVSTHPSNDRRIADLEEFMPTALIYYNMSGATNPGN